MGENQNGDVSGTEMVSGRHALLWQSGICAGEDIGLVGQPSRQRGIFGAVRQIFHRLDCKGKPPAGRKTRLRVAFLMGLPVKSAFALLLTKVTKEGLRPDAARTLVVRADTDKDRLRLRLSARLWQEYDSLGADFYVRQCSTVCSTKQAEIFCRKQERKLNTEVVLQFVRQKRILFYSMSNNWRVKNFADVAG